MTTPTFITAEEATMLLLLFQDMGYRKFRTHHDFKIALKLFERLVDESVQDSKLEMEMKKYEHHGRYDRKLRGSI